MPGPIRLLVLLLCVASAVAINLVACRWGTNCTETTVLSFTTRLDLTGTLGQMNTTGLFAAPWLEGSPLGAVLLGILLPMFLLGLGTYVAVRGPQEKSLS